MINEILHTFSSYIEPRKGDINLDRERKKLISRRDSSILLHYLEIAPINEDFSFIHPLDLRDHVDRLLTVHYLKNNNLVAHVTALSDKLTAYQRAHLISLLYHFGVGWNRREWLPAIFENLYQSIHYEEKPLFLKTLSTHNVPLMEDANTLSIAIERYIPALPIFQSDHPFD